eukprot:543275-Prorocentrum_minimum.AAC.1
MAAGPQAPAAQRGARTAPTCPQGQGILLLLDPEDENYHITIDEEQGEGPALATPKRDAAHRAHIISKGNLKIETEEVKPDYDINPTREWVIGDTGRYTDDNQR